MRNKMGRGLRFHEKSPVRMFTASTGVFAALMVMVIGIPSPSLAVIPAVIGPVQALLAIMPQILALLGAMALALLRPQTYRFLFRYLWAQKALVVGFCIFIYTAFQGLALLTAGKVAPPTPGFPWEAQAGTDRSGAVEGAVGPLKPPSISWNVLGRAEESVDATPAVVGNRVYYGTYVLKAIGRSTGTVVCRDLDSGGLVWSFDGSSLPGGVYNPIFSSPALGGEFKREPDGRILPRYLVIGEGFHTDLGRMTCFDLAPTYGKVGTPPRVNWVIQACCHVESSPCIHDGKVYFGAGDDGMWCAELETGKVLWHREGFTSYQIPPGTCSQALAGLVGKTVSVRGIVTVKGQTEEELGIPVLEPDGFRETASPPQAPLDKGNGFRREVFGRVTREPATFTQRCRTEKRIELSGVSVKIENPCLDVESSPIGVIIQGGPGAASRSAVIFGCGLGGNSIVCADADTGENIWTVKTPFPAYGAANIVGDRLLFGIGNGNMLTSDPNPMGAAWCLSLRDGSKIWEYPTKDGVMGAIPVRDGKAFIGSREGTISVVRLEDGTLERTMAAGSPVVCTPCVTSRAVFVTNNLGNILAWDREKGTFLWSFPLTPGKALLCTPVAEGEKLLVGSDGRGFSCLIPGSEHPDRTVPQSVPWTCDGGNPGRSGMAGNDGIPSGGEGKVGMCWRGFASDTVRLSPILAAVPGTILLTGTEISSGPESLSGKAFLAGVSPRTGERKWMTPVAFPATSIVANESSVFAMVPRPDGTVKLHAFSIGTGKETWDSQIEFASGTTLNLISRARLLAVEPDGRIYAFRAGDGAIAWQGNASGPISGAAAAGFNLVILPVGGSKPEIQCLDDDGGAHLWSATVSTPIVSPPVFSPEGVFLLSTTATGASRLDALEIVNGEHRWEYVATAPPLCGLVTSERTVYYAAGTGTMFVHSAGSGNPWKDDGFGLGPSPARLVIAEGLAFFAAEGRIGSWNIGAEVRAWTIEDPGLGRPIAAPLVVDHGLVVLTEKAGLVVFSDRAPGTGTGL